MRGLSLLECLIVLTLLCLTAGFAAPSLYEVRELTLMKQTLLQLESLLEKNHRQSMITNKTIELSLTALQEICGDCQFAFHKDKITFYESGTVSPGTLNVLRRTAKCQVTISLRGRIRSTCSQSSKD